MRARRLGVLAALAVSACGPGPILLLDMDVPMPAQRLLIYGTSGAQPISFQGRAGHTPLDVDGALRRLTLELPKDTTGPVTLTVNALGVEDRCVAALGSNTSPVKLDSGAGPYQVQVKLIPQPARLCDGGGAPLRALAVLPGATVVYAVGDQGTVLRWEAQKGVTKIDVSAVAQGSNLYGVFAFSDNEVWVVGQGGLILKGGVGGFIKEDASVTETLRGVHGVSPQDVWAVGDAGVVLRRQGTWAKLTPMNVTTRLNAVRARAGLVLMVGEGGVVLKNEGGAFSPVDNPDARKSSLGAIATVGENRFWLAGANGRLLTYQRGEAAVRSFPINDPDETLTGAWASDSGEVQVVSDKGSVWACKDGAPPCLPSLATSTGSSFTAIAGLQTPKDLWLAGAQGMSDLLRHVLQP